MGLEVADAKGEQPAKIPRRAARWKMSFIVK